MPTAHRLLLTVCCALFSAHAQTVTANVNAGTTPFSVAVSPVTNKIYVANSASSNVTVIDGATNTVTTTVSAGTGPRLKGPIFPVATLLLTLALGRSSAQNGSPEGRISDLDKRTARITMISEPNSLALSIGGLRRLST